MKKIAVWVSLASLAVISTASHAEGNAKAGASVFTEECSDCHSTTPGRNKRGPSLVGVMGRRAGSVTDFSGYSEAMKKVDWTWTAEKLEAYITAPKKVVPGGRMKYDGLQDAKDRADVIAYVTSLTK